MTPLWTAVLLMLAGFSGTLALVFVCALIAVWYENRQERRYVPSPEEAAWEAHCASTPGVVDWAAWEGEVR